jgi:hypothetical protein
MRVAFRAISVALILATLAFSTVGCGGGNPKSLAKQGADTMAEWVKVTNEGGKAGDPKYDAVMKKSDGIKKKVDKLSEADKKIYEDELGKLLNASK